MLLVTLQNNKKNYLGYNEWRKRQFIDQSPKDAHVILHLIPWLLNTNHPRIPGFIKERKEPFRVFNIANSQDILGKEAQFKKMFQVADEKLSVRRHTQESDIQGIFTIGSAGTISQTSHSDCDIWICIDRGQLDDRSFHDLTRKINIIKGWLDQQLKIPVYFFLTDVEDIRKCNFGNIDFESSGSTQKNILKEEFYRTSILICGKIPFWWVTCDPEGLVDYGEALAQNQRNDPGQTDLIDLGDLQQVEKSEYYGAALWQLNKSLNHPLKSIIKMLTLKMFLESPQDELLCNKFRRAVLYPEDKKKMPDPGLFTMEKVLDYYAVHARPDHFEFIKKCFYLRYELKLMSSRQSRKEEMAAPIFSRYKIDRREIYLLNDFDAWGLDRQTDFGGLMFEYVTDIYRDISRVQKGMRGSVAQNDMTIIGRKLASSMSVKSHKIPILHLSSGNINLTVLNFVFTGDLWQVHASQNQAVPVIANEDMVFCLTYMVWNGLFDPLRTRMQPNPTSATLQEIVSLGKMTRDVFGTYDITQVHFSKFLDDEIINKMLVIISFKEGARGLDVENISLVYKNNWEEIFVRRFPSIEKMKAFLARAGKISPRVETHFYIRRNNKYYEKIIEQTKNAIAAIIMNPDRMSILRRV